MLGNKVYFFHLFLKIALIFLSTTSQYTALVSTRRHAHFTREEGWFLLPYPAFRIDIN